MAALICASFGLVGCGQQGPPPPPAATNVSSNPLTAPADYVGAVGQAKKHAEKVVDVTSIHRAIQMFRAEEDRYPKDLNELVGSQYLPVLPKPPPGMKYKYDPQTGAVKTVPAP